MWFIVTLWVGFGVALAWMLVAERRNQSVSDAPAMDAVALAKAIHPAGTVDQVRADMRRTLIDQMAAEAARHELDAFIADPTGYGVRS